MTASLPAGAGEICVFCIFLVPLAVAGIALINTGLGRSRSAAHSIMTSLCLFATAPIAYFIFGYAWQGAMGGLDHSFVLSGRPWDYIAAGRFFLRGAPLDGSAASLIIALQFFSVGIAALVPLGAAAGRWRLGSACCSSIILAGFIYPLFAHWAWGGGWLMQLGRNFGIGHGYLDAGGSGPIQVVGGLTALSIAWIVGPRRNKYSGSGMVTVLPAHNAIFVLFGSLIALVGWLGLNSAGAILFAGADFTHIPLIVVNTFLAAASAGLTAAAITRIRFGKSDVSITANGWMGGLVASSAACPWVQPAEAIVVGIVAGGIVVFAIDWLEFYLKLDDPGGAVSVHALAGIWGVLSVGIFARIPGVSSGQFLPQLVGVSTLIGFILPLAYVLNWVLNRFYPQRVSSDAEVHGLDLHELGADAYPEFIAHADDFQR